MAENEHAKKLAGEWFHKAEEDELSARDILRHKEGSPGTVCFLSQQMAEKIFKGYLVYKGKELLKIHDLDALARQCVELDDSFESITGDARGLSDFYISTRYPGDYPEFTWPQAEKAFASAEKIKNIVLEKIK